jgi:hypothetical protein
VVEEDLPYQLTSASNPGLVEDRLEVVLHGVWRDAQRASNPLVARHRMHCIATCDSRSVNP